MVSPGGSGVSDRFDFVVIGGGPAGSTFAQLVADAGYSVLVLEAAKFPRFAVGEIIAPTGIWRVWDRLGITREDLDARFIRKYNGGWMAPSGELFNFEQDVFPEDEKCEAYVYTFDRGDYDHFLLERARAHGAVAIEEARVDEVLFDESGRMNGVRFTHAGATQDVAAKLVVDATGRVNFLARKLGLRQEIDQLKSFASFAHWEGARRNTGKEEGDVRICYQQDMWFWWAPLRGDRVSIGIVSNRDVHWDEYAQDPEAFYDKYVQTCPWLVERIREARRVTGFRPVPVGAKGSGGSELHGYHSYTTELAGDGWVIVGDAAGFIDPIFSAGLYVVQLAAARLADECIKGMCENDGELPMAPLQAYQEAYFKEFREILSHIQQFATFYFDERFVNLFIRIGNSRERIRRMYIDTFVAYNPDAIREYSEFLRKKFKFRGDEFGSTPETAVETPAVAK